MKKRSAEHRAAQKAGRERDFNICQVCGSHDKAEGHHIVDHQFFGAASRDNIVTLCHDCHGKAHRGLLDILKF